MNRFFAVRKADKAEQTLQIRNLANLPKTVIVNNIHPVVFLISVIIMKYLT
jgi:hypothetical protein